ncbi:MAG: hypothetical protein J6C19_02865 [Lachnospiraceae bacterium]|nr:hypothetical protein [Lachnospiraceae bacterium]MBO5144462.1 hypothetical protein [Lachnospiraceae bacterium]
MYFGQLYDQYIKVNELNIYGRKLIKIPTPKYVVLYNGDAEAPAREVLRLSDAFINPVGDYNFEWTAEVLNINPDRNEELLEKCRPLADYMFLVNVIRANQKSGMTIEDAVHNAVKQCIENGIMKEFLVKHEAEVYSLSIY